MTQKSFRALILLYLALIAASTAAAFMPTGYSQSLNDALDNEPMSPLLENLWLMLALVVPFGLAALAGMYGLFMFKRWGRWLSLYSTLMWGAILTLSYYSIVSGSFSGVETGR